MSSSSLSPADWIGGGEFVGIGVGEELYLPSEAAFHVEQQAPAPPLFDTLQADYRASGGAGSSSEGEPGKQSQTEASALSSSEGLAIHDNGCFTCAAAGARSLPLPARKDGSKIAFKTRSDVDVLDDGYRWRKYGKKLVKNSPNPRSRRRLAACLTLRRMHACRNYYRCSNEGCQVKKRVERARDDARFVITTYDGVHNHPAAPPARPLRGYRLADPPQGHRV
ncbi:putative WRKY transcription factor 50 [Dichanthelium oligosanthes]|uniref:Putative WRKY transcription factor 50 n=1 Tax=Dichanthelium oligosanthes TaxID=888268 RepID=A0A1E5UKQ0_9POAL|nr:putative WRKY transcription factor 50 [Dichanthelium oligosanthes]